MRPMPELGQSEVAAQDRELAEGWLAGKRRALAKAITLVESTREDHRQRAQALLGPWLPDATKPEVKAAVEMLFKVQVESVQIANLKGKVKRSRRSIGRRSDIRKAFVCLKPGQEINFAEGGAA